MQFLVEAITLSMAGGIFGAALGVAAAKAISFFAEWPTVLSVSSIAGSVLFSGAVGVFFGFLSSAEGLAARSDPGAPLRVGGPFDPSPSSGLRARSLASGARSG